MENNHTPKTENNSFFSNYKKFIILFFILVFPSVMYYYFSLGKHNMLRLQYFGNKELVTVTEKGKEKTDTLFHTIPDFNFTNQLGKIITQKDFENKIYVADFFFATCPGICPKLSASMYYVQENFKDNPEVMFLSHTVDPQKDTVAALLEYSKKVHANNERWHFVTGKKDEIYKQAIYGYLISANEDAMAPGGFLHSEMFVLIDKHRHIRGFYDGTSVSEMNRLTDEIKVLMAEELIPKKKKSNGR